MRPTKLIDYFQRARKSSDLAVIEGIQALKHAARFKAPIQNIVTCDEQQLIAFLTELAPDIKDVVMRQIEIVEPSTFAKLSPQPPRTNVIAVSKRTTYSLEKVVANRPLVFLEDPKDLENIGAVIRVAAAADAAGVCISGTTDIWHSAVIRGGAGLHYALPVLNVSLEEILKLDRLKISLDPTGSETSLSTFPENVIFIFGTERHGISSDLLKKSDQIIRLPMKKGVSSLNLATSVAATLYSRG